MPSRLRVMPERGVPSCGRLPRHCRPWTLPGRRQCLILGPLSRLALAQGIHLAWHDIWGNAHQVPAATLRALLTAMHVPADDDEQAQSSLLAHESERWNAVLPPAVVVRQSRLPARITLRLPAASALAVELATDRGEWRRARSKHRHAQFDRNRACYSAGARVRGVAPAARAQAPAWLPSALADGAGRAPRRVSADRRTRCLLRAALLASRRARLGAGGTVSTRCAPSATGAVATSPTCSWCWSSGPDAAPTWSDSTPCALFPHNPEHASPYSPSSRLFLNPLYLDPERIGDREQTRSIARIGATARESQRAPPRRAGGLSRSRRREAASASSCSHSAFRERLIAGDSDERPRLSRVSGERR